MFASIEQSYSKKLLIPLMEMSFLSLHVRKDCRKCQKMFSRARIIHFFLFKYSQAHANDLDGIGNGMKVYFRNQLGKEYEY